MLDIPQTPIHLFDQDEVAFADHAARRFVDDRSTAMSSASAGGSDGEERPEPARACRGRAR